MTPTQEQLRDRISEDDHVLECRRCGQVGHAALKLMKNNAVKATCRCCDSYIKFCRVTEPASLLTGIRSMIERLPRDEWGKVLDMIEELEEKELVE